MANFIEVHATDPHDEPGPRIYNQGSIDEVRPCGAGGCYLYLFVVDDRGRRRIHVEESYEAVQALIVASAGTVGANFTYSKL